MKIAHIHVTNYRNLNGLDVYLNPEMNFLVGENELGKSNFLDLLDVLFNRRSFSRGDFFNENEAIEIKISITLTDEEVGAFEDYFDPLDHNQANFVGRQESVDDLLLYYRGENYETNPQEISITPFRRLNYIKYSSLRTPKDELGFDRERGVGKFLNYLIRSTLENDGDTQEVLNTTAIEPILQRINNMLGKIKPLQKMGVGTFVDQEHQADLLARVLLLKNGNEFDIQRSGQGIQFSILLILSILERLIVLRTSRWWKDNIFVAQKDTVEKAVLVSFLKNENKTLEDIQSLVSFENDEVSFSTQHLTTIDDFGKNIQRLFENKGVTMILGLDEPEIHLHPYMQRGLIKYIARILKNMDEDFSDLLKDLLDLDEISGQAIVVSHSPNILLDDYKQIIRFYRDNGSVKSISGCRLNFNLSTEKQLLMHLPTIKEAFFSKCVVVVEGKTEQGAMSIWKDKVLGDADDLGISIIGADSCSSVEYIVELLNGLCILNVSIMDCDDNNKTTYKNIPGLFFTSFRDFEEDIYEAIISSQPNAETLFECLSYVDSGVNTYLRQEKLKQVAVKYKIDQTWDLSVSKFSFSDENVKLDRNLRKTMFLSFMGMGGIKSITFGRYIASQIDQIPTAYYDVLNEAKNKVEATK